MAIRLLQVAKQGLSSANKGNPFWSKSDAMTLINQTRLNIAKG